MIIALLTDFGVSDAYVGIMKGVMLSICPAARLVDLTHAIQPQNIRQTAYVLLTAYRHFPADTVFVVVVDPGVGTARAPVAVQTGQGTFVAPDNGVLSFVLRREAVRQSVRLENPAYRLPVTSQTFHGRDIFAPAAAHLACGVPLAALGPGLDHLVELSEPRLDIMPGEIHGEVLHTDHFGNLITSIGHLRWTAPDRLWLDPEFGERGPGMALDARACRVTAGAHRLGAVQPTYGAVPPGTLLALVGSSGQLEIAANQGSAAAVLGLAAGSLVTIGLSDSDFGAA